MDLFLLRFLSHRPILQPVLEVLVNRKKPGIQHLCYLTDELLRHAVVGLGNPSGNGRNGIAVTADGDAVADDILKALALQEIWQISRPCPCHMLR